MPNEEGFKFSSRIVGDKVFIKFPAPVVTLYLTPAEALALAKTLVVKAEKAKGLANAQHAKAV